MLEHRAALEEREAELSILLALGAGLVDRRGRRLLWIEMDRKQRTLEAFFK